MTESHTILDHFCFVYDPRNSSSTVHRLDEILVIAFCAAISGISSFSGMGVFAVAKFEWLTQLLSLPYGPPSHDTFRRVFELIDAEQFELAFIRWMRHAEELTDGQVVAIDGKSLRGSAHHPSGKRPAHLVSAWAAENGVSLGHVKTSEKSNEITAIPQLLDLLVLKGCIVTIDAMGCQKEIVEKIVAAEAGYVISVKDNQPSLKAAIEASFENEANIADSCETLEKSRGREERRRAFIAAPSAEVSSLGWAGLEYVGRLKATRTIDGVASYDERYYIIKGVEGAASFLDKVRSHWGIENALHWILDVNMGEDQCRVRTKNGERNLATLRRIAVNKLKKHQKEKKGISMRGCQSLCALSDAFREKVLASD